MRTMSVVRFRPPTVAVEPALLWCLARAFGPPETPVAAIAPSGLPAIETPVVGAHALASRLVLSPRLASRMPPAQLETEVGPEQAALFRRDRLATAAGSLRLGAVAEELACAASELDLPLVFLKFFALERSGLLAEGSRPAADLDLLVAPERAWELHRALVARGFTAGPTPEMEHQLPTLVAPVGDSLAGGAVEIHRLLLGVRLDGGAGSATAPTLAAAGLLLPARDLPGPCFVPAPEVLVAHALVHGLVQHGFAPHAYPALRLLSDWLDLLAAEEGGVAGRASAELVARAGSLVAGEVSQAEVAAMAGLCRRLATCDLTVLTEPVEESGEAALLHHFLAGALDPDYGRALRFAMLARPLSDRPRPLALARSLWKAAFPSRAELEAIYGPAGGPWQRWARRLGRPFDLVRRAARYAASGLSLSRRAPGARNRG